MSPRRCYFRGMGDGNRGIKELTAVGKRVRSHVEDTHHKRATKRQQRGKSMRLDGGFIEGTDASHACRFAR